MTQQTPKRFKQADACAEAILSSVGKKIVLGLPLGLGKANSILNALYKYAENDPSIELRIFTALTLGRPHGASELERRFLGPLFERLAGNYPELAYNKPLRKGRLPSNISVHEFYFPAGRRLNDPLAQQNYTSTNYTHVARDLLDNGINVIAQLVARRGDGEDEKLSLSCNPDVTLDVMPQLKKRRREGQKIAISCQVNDQLPFMLGPAVVEPNAFDFILEGPDCQFDLFAVPKQPVSLTDYACALHVAALIADGGTLQIGIGCFADALTHALKLRHHDNARFRALQKALCPSTHKANELYELGTFQEGLYAASEMLVEGLLELRRAGILKRRVTEEPGKTPCNSDPLIHAAFFLGSHALYEELRNLSEDELSDISMTSVSFVNQLYGNEKLKRQQRQKARFVNSALMATTLGAVVSDGLEDGRVVSGVGGQYNFIAQAHELSGARSIIALEAARTAKGRTTSNILWNYGHTTIPRHLRDIVVTEYGIADLRGKCDRDVVAAMLNITDSRYQLELLKKAKRAGKIEKGYEIPDTFHNNYPGTIERALGPAQCEGLLPEFPLGTDMTPIEVKLVHALKRLKAIAHSKSRLLSAAFAGAIAAALSGEDLEYLARLNLACPRNATDRLMRWSVLWALRSSLR